VTEGSPQILCHPDGEKSCGACCGMYNHAEYGEEQTHQRLVERTRAFFRETSIDDEESLREFRHRWEDGEDVKLLEALPSCPFLGYVDMEPGDESESVSRVGCLVHPLQNDGVDGRDCGVYDRFICDEYLCAAHDILRDEEVQLVLDAVDDSYLYGLLITNPKFVRQLLELVARRVGTMPAGRILGDQNVIEAASACFEMMRNWPYRHQRGIFGQVQVDDELNMTRRQLPGERHGVDNRDIDVLLLCLGTECEDIEELTQARNDVERRLAALSEAVDTVLP